MTSPQHDLSSELKTRMTAHIRGFVPVLTFRFGLDALFTPAVMRLSPAALISVPELAHRGRTPLPRLPLLIDSGGFLALAPGSAVKTVRGLGVIVHPDGTLLTPQAVHQAQQDLAHTGFTLDFPSPAGAASRERTRRARLSLANAAWALSQPRNFLLYACLQPGQDIGPLLELNPDGVALGGLVPLSGDRKAIVQQVRLRQKELSAARADLPLHVFGVGQPDTVRAIFAAGATSCDASSCQRQAASGKSWGMDSIGDASPLERLHLAVASLKVLNEAARTSAAHS